MRKIFLVGGIASMMLGSTIALSQDNAAIVFNSGRDGQTCTLFGFYSGTGDATFVSNAAGNVTFACHGLIEQTPPEQNLQIIGGGPLGTVCRINITPAGTFAGTCHN